MSAGNAKSSTIVKDAQLVVAETASIKRESVIVAAIFASFLFVINADPRMIVESTEVTNRLAG